MRICIAVPTYSGKLPVDLVSRLTHLDMPDGVVPNLAFISRCMIDKARNGMSIKCAMEGVDYVLFVDDDQIPDKGVVVEFLKVMDKGADIVGCPIPNRYGKPELAVFDEKYDKINDFKGTKEVGAVGMGCTLFRTQIVKDMVDKEMSPFEFMNYEIDGKIVEFSEDVNFCKRARELGFSVWCTDKVKAIHLGEPARFWYEDGEYKQSLNGQS